MMAAMDATKDPLRIAADLLQAHSDYRVARRLNPAKAYPLLTS